jgi:hypothetical protein
VTGKANLGASVAARLLNLAAKRGLDYQTVLTSYCLERFLYRLGVSDRRERFLLKGAMLLRLWSDRPYRATRDLDLLRRGERGFEQIHDDIQAIVSTAVSPDAVSFDAESIHVETIRAEDEYAGARATLTARLGSARVTLQIDMGVGDAVWPAPQTCHYPTFLEFPAPQILAYPREAVIAEKFEAMVILGDRNSRIKDFFDIHYLASHFEFDRIILRGAIRQTFDRRRTPIPPDVPVALTREYWANPSRPAQVRAFSKRAGISVLDNFTEACSQMLAEFLSPILDDLRQDSNPPGIWHPGGPWRA